MFSRTHRHSDFDDRLRALEQLVGKIMLGLAAGEFVVIAALIGVIAVLLAK